MDGSGNANWYLTDRQGSVVGVVSSTGSLLDTITYDAYGNVTSQSNAAASGRYLYTGREWDAALGLQYNRARWYDPATGRWIGEDPKKFKARDTNLNRYAGNSPTNAIDPSGRRSLPSLSDLRDTFQNSSASAGKLMDAGAADVRGKLAAADRLLTPEGMSAALDGAAADARREWQAACWKPAP